MEGIKVEVRKFLAEQVLLAGGAEELADDASFLEHGVLDSTGVLELVHFLDDTFGVKVADAEMTPENLDSIDAVAAFVARKRGGT